MKRRSDLSVPNVLTCFRIIIALIAAMMFFRRTGMPVAAVMCIVASLLDYFDGWYARRYEQKTTLGAHLDPFADKVLIAVVFSALAFELAWHWFTLCVIIMLAREAMITGYRMVRRRRFGTFTPASRLGKIKTAMQCLFGDSLLFYVYILPGRVPKEHWLVFSAMMITMFVTIDSGLRYMLPNCADGKKRSILERAYHWLCKPWAREV